MDMFNTATFDSIEGHVEGRRWSTVASFTLQAAAGGALLVFPLLHPETLPQIRYAEKITAPTAPRMPEKVMEVIATEIQRSVAASEIKNGQLMAPREIPKTTTFVVDPPDFTSGSVSDVPVIPGAIPGGGASTIARLLAKSGAVVRPPTADIRTGPLRVSSLSEGSLVRKVQPVYPPQARVTRTQGPVVLSAIIAADGRITSLHAISGHPFLIPAALDAVSQWRYRPYLLNGQPIEVETQITVMFTLQ
jgi:periplasmic protein TonB